MKLSAFSKIKIVALVLAVIFVIVVALRIADNGIPAPIDLQVEHTDSILHTPSQIRSVEMIKKVELLTIEDEELVDTIRRRLLGKDDYLARIYHGTLRLGFDMAHAQEGWMHVAGDSVYVKLPKIELLNKTFIDEARTRSFAEHGTWDAASRKAMLARAAAAMRRRALSKENIKRAEEQQRVFFERFFCNLGFQRVIFV